MMVALGTRRGRTSSGVLGTGLRGLERAGNNYRDSDESILGRWRGRSQYHWTATLFLLAAAVRNSLQTEGDAKTP